MLFQVRDPRARFHFRSQITFSSEHIFSLSFDWIRESALLIGAILLSGTRLRTPSSVTQTHACLAIASEAAVLHALPEFCEGFIGNASGAPVTRTGVRMPSPASSRQRLLRSGRRWIRRCNRICRREDLRDDQLCGAAEQRPATSLIEQRQLIAKRCEQRLQRDSFTG